MMFTYSSGTTGIPKIIPSPHKAYVHEALVPKVYKELQHVTTSGIIVKFLYLPK